MFPSMTEPTATPGLASTGLDAIGLGSWLNTGATGLSTISNAVAGGYQARVASNNAVLAQADAQSATRAGDFGTERQLLETGQLVGKEKATQGANNVDVNQGSAVDVRDATQNTGALDAAVIRYNAARAAYGYGLQASNYKTQSTMDMLTTGFNALGGGAKTYASYISGASALQDKKLAFDQSGVRF